MVSDGESPQPHGSIAHGSVVKNNWHRVQARDDFLITVDRASAFLSGAETIPFVDSDKATYLHIGNDPNRKKSAKTRKEKQLQRDPECARKKEERARKHAREEEEGAREEEDAALDGELIVMKAQERARKKVREIPIFLKKKYLMIETCDPTICGWTDRGEMLVVKNQVRYSFGF